jgi:glucose 1-dehydrogenase
MAQVPIDLSKKVALVTGAAQGIGRGVSLALASLGAHVVCCDLERQRAGAEETVALARAAGGDGCFVACDVMKRDDLVGAVRAAVEKFGGLDISVAVVGGNPLGRATLLEQTPESYEATIALTQHATFYQTQVSAQQMVAQKRGGSIVIIGSIMADFASFSTAHAYSMAKCAVRQLSKTAARELATHKIRVNTVQPGYIDTPGERT